MTTSCVWLECVARGNSKHGKKVFFEMEKFLYGVDYVKVHLQILHDFGVVKPFLVDSSKLPQRCLQYKLTVQITTRCLQHTHGRMPRGTLLLLLLLEQLSLLWFDKGEREIATPYSNVMLPNDQITYSLSYLPST